MARFRADESDKYGGNGGAGYFSLKKDKEVARVRFMYNGAEDIECYAVHEIELNSKKRYVNCLREYNQPVDVCPFCAAKKFQRVKLFIPLYNIDEERTQLWERGKSFVQKISSICARYKNTVSHIFEIERNGQPGDMKTSYEIFEVDKDDTTLEDLPEIPEVLGSNILDKTAEELQYYLDNGEFPDEDSAPVRRRSRRDEEPEDEEDIPIRGGRRTPASGRRREF